MCKTIAPVCSQPIKQAGAPLTGLTDVDRAAHSVIKHINTDLVAKIDYCRFGRSPRTLRHPPPRLVTQEEGHVLAVKRCFDCHPVALFVCIGHSRRRSVSLTCPLIGTRLGSRSTRQLLTKLIRGRSMSTCAIVPPMRQIRKRSGAKGNCESSIRLG